MKKKGPNKNINFVSETEVNKKGSKNVGGVKFVAEEDAFASDGEKFAKWSRYIPRKDEIRLLLDAEKEVLESCKKIKFVSAADLDT